MDNDIDYEKIIGNVIRFVGKISILQYVVTLVCAYSIYLYIDSYDKADHIEITFLYIALKHKEWLLFLILILLISNIHLVRMLLLINNFIKLDFPKKKEAAMML